MKIHIMGNLGSGARAVSYLAEKYGYEVSGCDEKSSGHDVNHLDNVDILVVSPALLYQKDVNPELELGKKRNIVLTWEEFVGKYLMKDKFVIAISGTHGKSTTTAMVAKIMEDAGMDPTVLIGAMVPDWKGNARFGKSKYFVIEADEFNDNFLHYHPDILVINNIEFDHPDYFKDENQLNESFRKFIQNLKPGGVLLNTHNHQKFHLQLFGKHNQDNADMAFQVAKLLGLPDDQIVRSLEKFAGIGRRMELIGETNGIRVYSDYAHHPTAIKTTLEGLREKYRNEKILAVIEPHGYKRTKALINLYKDAFDSVDGVVIGPIYKARDVVDNSVSSESIVKISNHKNIKSIDKIEDLAIDHDYNIVVVMGAGDAHIWAQKILKSLQH